MRRSDAEGSAVLEEEPLAFPEVVPAEGFDEGLAEVVPAEGFDEDLAEVVPVEGLAEVVLVEVEAAPVEAFGAEPDATEAALEAEAPLAKDMPGPGLGSETPATLPEMPSEAPPETPPAASSAA